MATSVAIIATFLGTLLGYGLTRTDIPSSRLLKILLFLPFFISPYYMAVAWRDLAHFTLDDTYIMKSVFAVGFILSLCYTPLSMWIMSGSFSNIDRRLEEAGLLSGGKWHTIRSITFPLVKPGLAASFILTFILAISEVSVSSHYVVKLYINEIFQQFSAHYDHQAAIGLGAAILVLCLLLIFAERSYLSEAPFLSIGKRGSHHQVNRLGQGKVPLLLAILLYFAFTVLLPIFMMGKQAFEETAPDYLRDKRLPGEMVPVGDKDFGHTTRFFENAFDLLQPVMLESLLYALIGAAVICFLGLIFAYLSEREGFRWVDKGLLIVFAVPSTIYGIALAQFYNRTGLEVIYTSMAIILIGYIGKFTFIASRLIGNSLKQIPRPLEESAKLIGASFMERFRRVLFPLIAEGFFTAFIVIFIFCLSEMATTIVIYPPGHTLLPIKIATSMHNTPQNLLSAMVLIVLSLTFLMLLLLYLVRTYLIKKIRHDHHTT